MLINDEYNCFVNRLTLNAKNNIVNDKINKFKDIIKETTSESTK